MEFFFIILYFLVIVVSGVYSFFKIKGNDDFYVAGKKSGTFLIAGSLLATILGSAAVLGTVDLSFSKGFASAWWLLCAAIGLTILLPISKFVKRFGKYTLPQMLGDFYGKEAAFISSIIISLAWIGIVAAQIIGGAKILASFVGLNYYHGVIIVGAVFIAYTILGGQYSVIKTDLIQILFILGGIITLFFFVLNLKSYSAKQMTDLSLPFNKNFTPFDLIALFLTLSTTYFVGPDIYSRIFCAKDEKTVFKSILLAIVILIPFAFILSFLGVFAFKNFSINAGKESALIVLSMKIMPGWALGLMVAALLSTVMSSADTTLLTAATILSGIFIQSENKKSISVTRALIFALGVLSIIFSLYVQSIISSLLVALTIFSGAFIIPTIAGLLGYRTVKIKSITAMIAGGVIALSGRLIVMNSAKLTEFLSLDKNNLILTGNIIIYSAFAVNALILFLPVKNEK